MRESLKYDHNNETACFLGGELAWMKQSTLYVLRDKRNWFVSSEGKLFEIKDDFIGSPIIGIVVIVIAVELELRTLDAFSRFIKRKSCFVP